MKRLIAIVFLIAQIYLPYKSISSQTVVLEETVSDDLFSRKYGPNGKHYLTQYFGIEAPLSTQNTQKVKPFNSIGVAYGVRYKYRLCNFLSTGFDITAIGSSAYSLKDANKLKPYDLIPKWDEEKLSNMHFTLGWYGRINIGKRGNHLGKYIDFGVYRRYNYLGRHKYWGENDNIEVQATLKSPDYLQNVEWGFSGGVGINFFRITCKYRSTNLLDAKSVNAIELPKWLVGIEIGWPGA